jgi:Tol biopolymer transport system component
LFTLFAYGAASGAAAVPPADGIAGGEMTRVSVSSDGDEGDRPSGNFGSAISADGRYVVYASLATNLVPDDENDSNDVFLHDRNTGETVRASVGPGGVEGNKDSSGPALSADGRFVSFISAASNLVADDTNQVPDMFVWDRVTGVTERVSIAWDGAEANGDSRYRGAISRDGRYVAFKSNATNMVQQEDTNDAYDVFVRDRVKGKTKLVSVGMAGAQADDDSGEPAITPDGRYIAFQSRATNLVPDDDNGAYDVFVRDTNKKKTRLVSVDTAGGVANGDSTNPSIAVRGRLVAFASEATDLVEVDTNDKPDVYLSDRDAGMTLVSVSAEGVQGNKFSGQVSLSVNGRYLAFNSDATNLVPDDTNRAGDVFVWDRVEDLLTLVSLGLGGAQGDGESSRPAITGDGRSLAMTSDATNLVVDDTNDKTDVFARDLR